MKTRLLALLLLLAPFAASAQSTYPTSAQRYTWAAVKATGAISPSLNLQGLGGVPPSMVVGIAVQGTAPSACTFEVDGSADGTTWSSGASSLSPAQSCTATRSLAVPATANYIRLNVTAWTQGDSTSAVQFSYTRGAAGSGGGGAVSSVNGQTGNVNVKAVSQRVVYASVLLGTTGDATVAAGSSAAGTTDRAAALNAALSGGNVELVVDGQYALSTSLVLYSNTTLRCLPGMGLIMQAGSNAEVLVNAHPNAPTTANSTGGFVVSNITDTHLAVRGCILNANSTEAVTGTDLSGVAHKKNPTTGLWVQGARFAGVNDLAFQGNEVYDAGTYAFGASNLSNAVIADNYLHVPLPLVQSKNTDGAHVTGPAANLQIVRNRIISGDDALPLNADDGNKTGSGDANSPYGSWPGWKWGTITSVTDDGNFIDGSTSGFRIYDDTDPITGVQVLNTYGTCLEECFNITAQTSLGAGNVGLVTVDNWAVQSNGSYTGFGYQAQMITTANIQQLVLGGLKFTNPATTWPLFQQSSGTINSLTVRGLNDYNPTGSAHNLIVTNGTVGQIIASGFNWTDAAANTTTAFSGTAPAGLTLSSYNGPNRILAAGYAPTAKNGDAFQNQYLTTGPGTTYLSTTFAESHSASLNGIVPATETDAGAAWAVGSGAFTTGASSGVVASGGGYALLPVNQNNYTLTTSVSGVTTAGGVGDSQIFVRLNDTANFELIEYGTDFFIIKDYTANAQTVLAGGSGSYPSGNTITITVNGNAISATLGTGQTLSATIPPGSSGVSSGTKIGIGENGSSNTITYSSLSLQGLNGTTSVSGGIADSALGNTSAALKASTSTQAFSGPVTAPRVNGEYIVNGTSGAAFTAAWNAAVAAATSSNQTVRITNPGTYSLSAQIAEPDNGYCVNLIGPSLGTATLSLSSSIGASPFFVQGDSTQTIGCTISNVGFSVYGNASQALWIKAGRRWTLSKVYAMGGNTEACAVGDTVASSGSTHFMESTIDGLYCDSDASLFGSGLANPAYSLHIYPSAQDNSNLSNITLRDGSVAMLKVEGGNNNLSNMHGYGGYSANIYATPLYMVEDTHASWSSNRYFGVYSDGVQTAAFHIGGGAGSAVIASGGTLYQPDSTTYTGVAVVKFDAGAAASVIRGFDCIHYTGPATSGTVPTGSTIDGLVTCGVTTATPVSVGIDNPSTVVPAIQVGTGGTASSAICFAGLHGCVGFDNSFNLLLAAGSASGIRFATGAGTIGGGTFVGGFTSTSLAWKRIGTAMASSSTISPTGGSIFHVTGTAAVATITAPTGCTTTAQACSVTLIPDGAFTTTTGGNIATASTAVVGRQMVMTYDAATSKWYPSY